MRARGARDVGGSHGVPDWDGIALHVARGLHTAGATIVAMNMFTQRMLRDRSGDERQLLRAKALATPRYITVTLRSDTEWHATIQGSEGDYAAILGVDLQGRCSCTSWKRDGTRRFCKHLAAIAMMWLEAGGANTTHGDLDPELSKAMLKLSNDEVRAILMEAAGQLEAVRARVVLGRWR